MRSREDVLDSSAEAARWVADALANARTWFPDISDEDLRGPLEQAFKLAGRSVRGEREYHAVFEAELHRAIEERAVLGASGSVLPAQSNDGPRAFPFGIARSADPVQAPPSIAPVEPLAEEAVELPIEAAMDEVESPAEVRFGEGDRVDAKPRLAPEPDDHLAEPAPSAPPFAATEIASPADDRTAHDPFAPAREHPRVPIPTIKADELRRHVRTEAPAPRPAPPRGAPTTPARQRPGKRRAIAWRRPVAVSLVLLMLAPLTVVLVVILSRGGHHGPRPTTAVAHRTVPATPRRPSHTDAIARQHRIAKLEAARRHARAVAHHRYLAQRAAYRRKLAVYRRRTQRRPATAQRAATPAAPTPAPRPVSPPPAAPSHSSNGGGGSGGSSEFGIEP